MKVKRVFIHVNNECLTAYATFDDALQACYCSWRMKDIGEGIWIDGDNPRVKIVELPVLKWQ